MPAMPKPTVWSIMVGLAACLTAEITNEDNDIKIPCRIFVAPGDSITPEYEGECAKGAEECGLAWVRLVNAYPASGVGQQNLEPDNCNSQLGYTINMGIVRCFNPGEARSGPSVQYLEQTAKAQIEDMLAMRRAIACCKVFDPKDTTLSNYVPLTAAGTRIGGAWNLSGILP